jgi:hypothetical protein
VEQKLDACIPVGKNSMPIIEWEKNSNSISMQVEQLHMFLIVWFVDMMRHSLTSYSHRNVTTRASVESS